MPEILKGCDLFHFLLFPQCPVILATEIFIICNSVKSPVVSFSSS